MSATPADEPRFIYAERWLIQLYHHQKVKDLASGLWNRIERDRKTFAYRPQNSRYLTFLGPRQRLSAIRFDSAEKLEGPGRITLSELKQILKPGLSEDPYITSARFHDSINAITNNRSLRDLVRVHFLNDHRAGMRASRQYISEMNQWREAVKQAEAEGTEPPPRPVKPDIELKARRPNVFRDTRRAARKARTKKKAH